MTQGEIASDEAVTTVEPLYELVERLPHYSHGTPDVALPENGIYLFFERGETVRPTGREIDRIVRVGSHPADGRLRIRIRDHYGPRGRSGGDKWSSVFRKHIGSALMRRSGADESDIRAWMHDKRRTIPAVEELATRTLRGSFTFTMR